MMNITLHQLRVFKAVSQFGSITQAANSLHMTQPAVSNLIAVLEKSLGAEIIEIVGKKVYLTHEGSLLQSAYDQMLKILEETHARINTIHDGLSGHIRVATVSTAKYFVPRLLGAFQTLYPSIKIELKVKNREEIIERLRHNLDDFVIMSQLPSLIPIRVQEFYEDELVVAASGKTAFTSHPTPLSLKILADQPWLIRETGSGTRIAMLKILKRYRISPRIEMEIDNNESIKQAIIANIGISMLSRQSIDLEEKAGLIKILPVQGFPIKHKWYLVTLRGKKLSTLARAFQKFVQSHPNLADFSKISK